MHYKNIKGKELIARVIADYTLDSTQWLYLAPVWMSNALAQLKIPQTLAYARTEDTVVDYKCELPVNLKLLIAVEYNGYRMRRLGSILNMTKEGLESRGYSWELTYEILNGEMEIATSFETGDIIFHYREPIKDIDTTTGISYPRIPDDPYVIQAVQDYILLSYLRKGYKHPLFNLNDNNEATNPYLAWELNKKRARNSVNVIDADAKEEISLLTRKFLQNYNSHQSVFFGGNSTFNSGTTMFSSSIVNNTNKKYKVAVDGLSTLYIPAQTHQLGTEAIPMLFINNGTSFVQNSTEFIVDDLGNVTWNGGSIVTDGYIVIV